MGNNDYKKYTIQAKTGIKGEAFFESLIANYSLPYHVMGLTDIGIDYFCEWVYGDRPTGILYGVQVKTFSEQTAKPKPVVVTKDINKLEEFEIKYSELKVDQKTLYYWKGLGIPIYLFAIVKNISKDGSEKLDCYYKRYAPIITRDIDVEIDEYYRAFYKVNNGSSFLAFGDFERKTHGFARDLYIDCVRLSYSKGVLPCLKSEDLGLNQFKKIPAFADLFQDYEKQILEAYRWTGQVLEVLKQMKDSSSN